MLSINITELLSTVLGFFVLMFLLDKLLYKPVLGFRAKRFKAMDESYSKQEQARDERQVLDEELKGQRSQSLRWARATQDQANEEAEEQSHRALEQLQRRREDMLRQGQQEGQALYSRSIQETRDRGPELARALADRLSR